MSLYAGVSVSGVVLGGPLGGALYSAAPGLLWPLCAALAALAGGAVLWMSVRVARGARESRPGPAAHPVREPAVGEPVPGPGEDPAGHDPRPAHETGSRPRAVAG